MQTENKIYPNFKSYSQYQRELKTQKANNKIPSKRQLAPLLGSALGVGLSYFAASKLPKKQNGFLEALKVIMMAFGANIGGILGANAALDHTNPKNAIKQQKKLKEASFQIMNISIPMILVSSSLELCKHVKKLNNNPSKIIGSIVSMVTGAFLATKITNLTKEKHEEKRKYTFKDTFANVDDIAATIVIGFPQFEKLNLVAKSLLPFIYTYSGYRAGSKE